MATVHVTRIPSTGSANRRLILGASIGTIVEFYDLYLFSALSSVIAQQFFAGVNETAGLMLALVTFSAGFFVRPLGGLLFGSLGDRIGRKRTFLVTVVIMGTATAAVGVLPTYASAGVLAPVLLVILRLAQGLAIGGEYGGAVVYVCEYAPAEARGRFTGWIQTNSALGLVLSLTVVMVARSLAGPAFDSWGWRVPFLLSLVLLLLAVYVRSRLEESPVFEQIRRSNELSPTPAREVLGRWENLKSVLLVVFGMQPAAAIWYCCYVYALLFLTQVLRVEATSAALLVAAAILLTVPINVLAGAASDRFGRKLFFVGGLLLGAVTLIPLFKGIAYVTNPARVAAAVSYPVIVSADPRSCSFQFDLIGKARFASSCDIARAAVARAGVPYRNSELAPGAPAVVHVGTAFIAAFDGSPMRPAELKDATDVFRARVNELLSKAGYNTPAPLLNWPLLLLLLFCLIAPAATFYGVVAVWVAESFPARIRYTSFSFPYHLGVAVFGSTVPAVAFALVSMTGDSYAGLWFPALGALWAGIASALFLPESRPRAKHPYSPQNQPAARTRV